MKKRHSKNDDNTSEGGEVSNLTSNRPKNNTLTQQRLPAINPTYGANTVLPFLFIVGILFLGIGVGILITSLNIQELEIDYTNCEKVDSKRLCREEIIDQQAADRNCNCVIKIELEEDWEGEVLMYYGLRNFYQNHRLYVDSKNTDQLLGKMRNYNTSDDEDDCGHFYTTETMMINDKEVATGKIFFPCGAIANSMFSDVITLLDKSNKTIPLKRTGIAWESDKEHKFNNPAEAKNKEDLKRILEEGNFTKPKDWKKNLWELDPADWSNNGLNNEDLIVWMRTAALPNFRKLYRRIPDGLTNGTYYLDIEYNFEVASFEGEKNIVLTTRSVLGGKSLFLGVTYIVVGGFCTILGVVFLFVHLKWGSRIKRGKTAMDEASR